MSDTRQTTTFVFTKITLIILYWRSSLSCFKARADGIQACEGRHPVRTEKKSDRIMNDANPSLLTGNRLLSALSVEDLAFLRPRLEHATYSFGTILAEPGDRLKKCFFPLKGMISLLSVTEQGNAVEIAYTGREGMVGVPVLLGKQEMPYQAVVQAPTQCLVADVSAVVELFGRGGQFHDLLMRYIYAVIRQISQTCVCNHYHTIEARLCRWLTVMAERSEGHRLQLTQEFLSHMLGVQRTSIGLIAHSIQQDGIIRYSRGNIEIIDLERLRASACECYLIVEKEFDSLFGA
jgi:CRP-like cAMP-binding protein